MKKRLEGKVAIVMGAGSIGPGWGNGKATAAVFAQEGARVVAVDRNMAAAEETASIITTDGGQALPWCADISSETDLREIVRATVAEFGRVDVLQNNVGIGIAEPSTEITRSRWDLTMKVNLYGMYLSSTIVGFAMAESGGGSIVNVSSIASITGTDAPLTSYGASKAGVNQLTRSLAKEYRALRVRCNAVVPGMMDTPTIYAGLAGDGTAHDELYRKRVAICPMGRMGDAFDVAYAALFLASDQSTITGQLLLVDGALSVQCTDRNHGAS